MSRERKSANCPPSAPPEPPSRAPAGVREVERAPDVVDGRGVVVETGCMADQCGHTTRSGIRIVLDGHKRTIWLCSEHGGADASALQEAAQYALDFHSLPTYEFVQKHGAGATTRDLARRLRDALHGGG